MTREEQRGNCSVQLNNMLVNCYAFMNKREGGQKGSVYASGAENWCSGGNLLTRLVNDTGLVTHALVLPKRQKSK